jgi:hypothetical protein
VREESGVCKECYFLLKGYKRAMRERVRCEDRMCSAMNATDLTSFERFSDELRSLSAAETGAKTALANHLTSPCHWFKQSNRSPSAFRSQRWPIPNRLVN